MSEVWLHWPDERPDPEQQPVHVEGFLQCAVGAEDRGNFENVVALHRLSRDSQDLHYDGLIVQPENRFETILNRHIHVKHHKIG